ncbi:MAG: Bax inhibitor-1 family protein [Lysinibacillus sp.]
MEHNQNALQAVMKSFAIMWVITAIGMFVGTILPPAIAMAASLVALVLLIITIFVRSAAFSKFVAYLLPFLMGIGLFWSTQFYINELGEGLVLLIFFSTVAIFIILGLVGSFVKADLSGFGKYLFGALLVAIVVSIVFVFVPVSNLVHLVLTGVILLIFVLYTIYDFNRIRQHPPTPDEVPMTALNLYLDFINLFLRLLEFVYRLNKD